MSLRRRLAFAVLATTCVTAAGAGVAFSVASAAMWRGVDADISAVADASAPAAVPRPGSEPPPPVVSTPGGRMTVTVSDRTGNVVSGPGVIATSDVSTLAAGWHTLDHYRVLVRERPRGGQLVVAADVSDLVRATRLTLYALVVSAVVAVLSVAFAMFWVWRGGLRPLSRIAASARAVADGARFERVDASNLSVEASVVADAVNHLLDSQQHALEQEAANTEQQRRFLLDAGHELRTPLTVIRGWADLLTRNSVPDDRVADAHERVAQEAARLSRLVEQLLAVARAEQFAPTLAASCDVAALCHQCAQDHRMLDASRSVFVSAPPAARAAIDPDAATQVVTNLLANLRAHTPSGTTAQLSVAPSSDGRLVHLVYDDNGPGVQEASRVFDRFWQADPARASGGTGLGMALVRSLVSGYGGTVDAGRSSVGGLRVSITLPSGPS